jgi:sugar phosphate isomerase/epimerase
MTGNDQARPLAVMAYTVLEQAKADLDGTLARVAEIGYLGIETYGLVEHFGPDRVKRAIADAGLELTSAHTPFAAGAEAERLLDENEALGARILVWSMEREEFDSPASISAGLARIDEAAERAAERGMTIAYHNHFAEFSQVFDGRTAYELLLEQLDARVIVELDAYWTQMGGAQPAQVLRDLGERARLIHIKDGPAISYEDDIMVPIGDGQIDWRQTLTTPSGLDWHIVELERLSVDTFDALKRSYDHLVAQGLSRGSVAVAEVAS